MKFQTLLFFSVFLIVVSAVDELYQDSVILTLGANNSGRFGIGNWWQDFWYMFLAPTFLLICTLYGVFSAPAYQSFTYPYDVCLVNTMLTIY